MSETNTSATPPTNGAQPQVEATVTPTDSGVIVETQQTQVPPMGGDSNQAQTPPTQPQETTNATAQLETDLATQKAQQADIKADLATRGIDFDALAQEYDTYGALSNQTLADLAKSGYPKSVVDAYITGLEAVNDRFVAQVQSFAGGAENYGRLVEFMRTQPQNVIDGFNAAIQSGNMAQVQLAVQGIQAQMTQKFGTSNPSVMAGQQGAQGVDGYQTTEQMVKDMSDPRYQTDPAFTQEVYRKLGKSALF